MTVSGWHSSPESNWKFNGHMSGLLAKQKNRCNDTI